MILSADGHACVCIYARAHTLTLTVNLQGETSLLASHEVFDGIAGVAFLWSLTLVLQEMRIGEIKQWEIDCVSQPLCS